MILTLASIAMALDQNRSAHDAIEQVLEYLDDGYQWVIDLDIEKYFDTVNHDKLISIIRERVNDRTTLHLIRAFLKAGIMEDGLVKPYKIGVPQGGPLSPILSKLYNKIRELLCRRKAAAQPLSLVFTKVNQVVRGWINYFKSKADRPGLVDPLEYYLSRR